MKEPRRKVPDAIVSLLIVLCCIAMGSILVLLAINTNNVPANNIGVNIGLSAIAIISIIMIIFTIIMFKKGNGDDKK